MSLFEGEPDGIAAIAIQHKQRRPAVASGRTHQQSRAITVRVFNGIEQGLHQRG